MKVIGQHSHASGSGRSSSRSAALALARGLAGGIVATIAMSAVMLAAQRTGLMGRMPPKKISDALLARIGIRRAAPEGTRTALATLGHFAFGGMCGALFGLAHQSWPVPTRRSSEVRHRRAPLLAGLAFGTAIWTVSYAGWVPALRIMPPPQDDRPGRPTSMLLAHWVFGAVLAKSIA